MVSTGRLFFLDLGQTNQRGRILSCKTDGSDLKTLVDNLNSAPDGIALDHERRHIWWTNMGPGVDKDGNSFDDNGSIQRCDVDGENVQTIIPIGVTHTPKQCIIAPKSNKLYWCDREGMRVMRSNLDGSEIEILIVSGTSEKDMHNLENWCVGVAVDEKNSKLYWTQKGPPKGGKGRIFRAGLDLPTGETPGTRSDIETLFGNLPEPIDLEMDEGNGLLYWTDRGAPPKGNTVNRAFVGPGVSVSALKSSVLVENLHEGIGIALDYPNKRMFFGDLEGSVYEADLDGSNEKVLLQNMGNTTGIAYIRT